MMIWFAKNRFWQHLDQRCELKICIIGSSHTASLKLGWDLVRDQFSNHELVFFGSLGKTLRHLRAKDGKLVSVNEALTKNLAYTSGGFTEIDVGEYDAVVLYGLILKLPRLRRGISKAVMQETMKDISETGLTLKIATRLRKLGDKRFWIASNPLEIAPGGVHDPEPYYSYDVLLAELQRVFPVPDVTFLSQPAETIGPDLRAPSRFGSGSVRLLPPKAGAISNVHPEGEVLHMNGEFGRFWLLENLPLIVQGAGG